MMKTDTILICEEYLRKFRLLLECIPRDTLKEEHSNTIFKCLENQLRWNWPPVKLSPQGGATAMENDEVVVLQIFSFKIFM